jgi:hypothetical protein
MSFQYIKDLQNEEDIRTKLVSTWLSGHGISSSNIHLEHRFTIRLGRSILRVENGTISSSKPSKTPDQRIRGGQVFHPRADILVRNGEGHNLLIIEVKGPNEVLDDEARDQGISYARLLNGNIAPFVVLTNGRETRIFDSVTRQMIDGEIIPSNHPYVRAGYRITGEDLFLRAEALEQLVSLSSDNLIAFSTSQSSFRMARLRSDDLASGKKYIPALYIDRKKASERLRDLLDLQRRRVVIVMGPPQVGKTNFICRTVEERLAGGQPCLFYPAIGIRQSLLHEISEDFEWALGDAKASPQYVFSKLRTVLRRSGTTLVLFIDGWNEANLKLAREIDYDCERLSCDEIQIVISLTNVTARRLLGGAAGNPSFIAEMASINADVAQRIEIDPHIEDPTVGWSAVEIDRYSETERESAYCKYGAAYDVTVPETHKRVAEPYMLGNAMRLFQHSILPNDLDEPDLLRRIIEGKAARAADLEPLNVPASLYILAQEMLLNGSPVTLHRAAELWNIPVVERIPTGFFESALLAEVTNKYDLPSIDFYYGGERDFIVAYWVQNWFEKVMTQIDVKPEFDLAVRSQVGLDALRWFLKQPLHIKALQLEDGSLPYYENALVRITLISSLCELSANGHSENPKWLEYSIDRATKDPDKLVRIEAVKLVALLTGKGRNDLTSVLSDNELLKEFLIGVLSINDEYPFQADSVGELVLEALHELANEDISCSPWDDRDPAEYSDITKVLLELMSHNSSTIREGARSCLGYIAPIRFLTILAKTYDPRAISLEGDRLREWSGGLQHATDELHEQYYGTYCKGWLARLREERIALGAAYRPDPDDDDWIGFHRDFKKFSPIFGPVISMYQSGKNVEVLKNMLEDLQPYSGEPEEAGSKPSLDIFTIPLPFAETNSNRDEND